MLKYFTTHPASVNQSYWAHLLFACSFGFIMLRGGIACIIHALFPFMFQTTGSDNAFYAIEKYLKARHSDDTNDALLMDCITKRKQKCESASAKQE